MDYEDEKLICIECDAEIGDGELYFRQTDNSVLCESCYKDRIWLN